MAGEEGFCFNSKLIKFRFTTGLEERTLQLYTNRQGGQVCQKHIFPFGINTSGSQNHTQQREKQLSSPQQFSMYVCMSMQLGSRSHLHFQSYQIVKVCVISRLPNPTLIYISKTTTTVAKIGGISHFLTKVNFKERGAYYITILLLLLPIISFSAPGIKKV